MRKCKQKGIKGKVEDKMRIRRKDENERNRTKSQNPQNLT